MNLRVQALERGLTSLLRAQHPAGSWTDFWLPVGTSDAWVTAYVGLALHAVSVCPWLPKEPRYRARTAAQHAAQWLLTHEHPRGGWGYNAAVSADADSTAHALSLLARLGQPIPAGALAILRAHEVDGEGFRTYLWPNPAHAWTRPSPDVTAAALRALHDLGDLSTAGLHGAWTVMLAPQQTSEGLWTGFWWTGPAYPTGLTLEVWAASGRPTRPEPPTLSQTGHAFDLAWQLRAQQALGQPQAAATTAQLLSRQADDGAWPGAPILRVPPAHPASVGFTLTARDDRRVFTTASVLRALALGDPDSMESSRPRRSPTTSAAPPHPLHDVVTRAALAAGLTQPQAQDAQTLFAHLTRLSLHPPGLWPSRQLTALSGGLPLEFSCVTGPQVPAALRYAAEVGDPFLPPPARTQSGLRILEDVAAHLGFQAGWARLWPALRVLTDPMNAAPDGTRFTVWGGVNQVLSSAETVQAPALKIYLNTLHRTLGGGRARIDAALDAAGFAVSNRLRRMLDLLDQAGFPQEVGFALGGQDQVACKLYYELHGWRPALIETILSLTDLPARPEVLKPEIPGLIRAGLARKSRSGIGLRIDPVTGDVRELMVACAFPTPLLPLHETVRRVETWLRSQGDDPAAYLALVRALLSTWPDQHLPTPAMHSLFTQTVTHKGRRTALYLRPFLQGSAEPAPV
ncbi:hypothetical protein GO986_06700 [Deinococcus sp. HMF7620]|uniref:Squalene cyclase C-terminal domain-containing protein n=1 Tax=Deinococcus arboris TaxID=2682977 RepID=A0A7C9I2E1_9DEIO|nr:hypothetical protein [Deinococcus arboris]MVN86451.1 hypothetical protein [Deinococcus arboris]